MESTKYLEKRWGIIVLMGLIFSLILGFVIPYIFLFYTSFFNFYLLLLPFILPIVWLVLCAIFVKVHGTNTQKEIQKTALYPFLSFIGFIFVFVAFYATFEKKLFLFLVSIGLFYFFTLLSQYYIKLFFKKQNVKIPWNTVLIINLLGEFWSTIFWKTLIKDEKLRKFGWWVIFTLGYNFLSLIFVTIFFIFLAILFFKY